MGICLARWAGSPAVLLGQRANAQWQMAREHLARPLSEGKYASGRLSRNRTGGFFRAERLWPLRHGWQRVGMVRRLVLAGLLRQESRKESTRTGHELRSQRTGRGQAGATRRFVSVQ